MQSKTVKKALSVREAKSRKAVKVTQLPPTPEQVDEEIEKQRKLLWECSRKQNNAKLAKHHAEHELKMAEYDLRRAQDAYDAQFAAAWVEVVLISLDGLTLRFSHLRAALPATFERRMGNTTELRRYARSEEIRTDSLDRQGRPVVAYREMLEW